MVVPRRSLLFNAAVLPLAPPSRLSSPLPLYFRCYRHNHSDQFSPFNEPDTQPRERNTPPRKATRDSSSLIHDGRKKRKPALSIAEVKADLADTEWALSNNLTGIQRRYVFRDFERAFKYIALVVGRCKGGSGHFPMCSNWGNRLFIRWTSYNSSCITRSDIQMARVCDRLYEANFAEAALDPKYSSKKIPDDLVWEDDRQVTYGDDSFYSAKNHLDLWKWLPQVELYALKEQAYPLWGISHNRLVCSSLLWDVNSGRTKAITSDEKSKWRPGAPLQKVRGERLYWLSNLADCVSQHWNPDSWVEKPENPKRLPLRFSMARSNETLEKEKEKELPQNGQPQRNKPKRIKNVRIYVD